MISLTLLLTAWPLIDAQISSLYTQNSQGDGTFYGSVTNGHCSFTQANAVNLPWTTGTQEFVALNHLQYGDSTLCGMCVQLHGTGPGSGETPISSNPQYAIVADSCPGESSFSHLWKFNASESTPQLYRLDA